MYLIIHSTNTYYAPTLCVLLSTGDTIVTQSLVFRPHTLGEERELIESVLDEGRLVFQIKCPTEFN